jgi:hypothetical protein
MVDDLSTDDRNFFSISLSDIGFRALRAPRQNQARDYLLLIPTETSCAEHRIIINHRTGIAVPR